LAKQTSTEKDLESITLALKSLNSAIEDKKISNTLEKVKSIGSSKSSSSITVEPISLEFKWYWWYLVAYQK